MKKILLISIFTFAISIGLAQVKTDKISGSMLANHMSKLSADARDSFVEECIASGSYPDFMNEFVRIDVQTADENGKTIKAYYFVAPDYLSIGTDDDFIRMPIQTSTAQRIADRLDCFLSTRKICDDVYRAAIIKLEPHPLTEDRDSLYTFIEHNNIVERQRKGYLGLIAGHKKDVVITTQLFQTPKNDRVALYGWHRLDGKPIQNIYIGHVDWYVDYSHGIRLVQQTVYVDGKPMNYKDVMSHPVYSKLICDEDACNYYAYPTENNSKQ